MFSKQQSLISSQDTLSQKKTAPAPLVRCYPQVSKDESQVFSFDSFDISKVLELERFWFNHKVNRFQNRIDSCPDSDWMYSQCKNSQCLHIEKAFRITCMSPFCQHQECVQNRVRVARKYLEEFQIKSPKIHHVIFNFEFCDVFTDEIRRSHSKVFSLIRKKMIKRMGRKFYAVVVQDINRKANNKIHPHYHSAVLPMKDMRLFRWHLFKVRDEIEKQTNIKFTIKFLPFKNREQVFRYLSHRIAGVFGDLKRKRTFGYSDVMDNKTYFKTFYNRRKIRLINIKHSPFPQEGVLALQISQPSQICPVCGVSEMEFRFEHQLVKPPPPITSSKAILQETKGLYLNDIAGSLCNPDSARFKTKAMQDSSGCWHGVDWVEKHKEFYPEFYPPKIEFKINKENLECLKSIRSL